MSESNSSRIEKATRSHVGAVLTSEQIHELVKLSDPTSTKGVYPSDVAYKRTPEGLVPRGKVAYGDGILEMLAENSYKVLADNEIVRRKPLIVKKETVIPQTATPTPTASQVPVATVAEKKGKKAPKSSSQPPVAPKSKARSGQAVQ